MEATNILMSEHRVIERVITAIEANAGKLENGQPIRPGFFLDAADFVRGFADGCHHRKEENVLFKTMTRFGVSEQGGPVGVMLYEHEQGRSFIREMRGAAQKLEDGDTSAGVQVVQAARGYAQLLRQHIQKEDNILFPMADRVIPANQHGQVMEDFEHVEHEETGEGVHEKFLAIAGALEQEAGIG